MVTLWEQISFGPISWIMVGEVFPLAVRGPAIALATLTNFGTNFVVRCSLHVPAMIGLVTHPVRPS